MTEKSTPTFGALYIHIPFCQKRCTYCDFYTLVSKKVPSSEQNLFWNALKKELSFWKPQLKTPLNSLFFGGGTPSLAPLSILVSLLNLLPIDQNTECTLEANPQTLNRSKLQELYRMGINRLSIGVQSLENDHLKTLGRIHDASQVLKVLHWAFEIGFKNVSVDLLFAIPNQTLSKLKHTLELLNPFPITHVSTYALTLAPTHSLFSKQPSENVQAEQFLFLHDFFKKKTWEHYEISNFSKPGFASKHNQTYWNRSSYLGCGPAAHSFSEREQTRWKNPASLKAYLHRLKKNVPSLWEPELLSEKTARMETIMLGFRQSSGLAFDLFTKEEQNLLRTFQTEGLLKKHPQHPKKVHLTPKGMLLLDACLIRLFSVDSCSKKTILNDKVSSTVTHKTERYFL